MAWVLLGMGVAAAAAHAARPDADLRAVLEAECELLAKGGLCTYRTVQLSCPRACAVDACAAPDASHVLAARITAAASHCGAAVRPAATAPLRRKRREDAALLSLT